MTHRVPITTITTITTTTTARTTTTTTTTTTPPGKAELCRRHWASEAGYEEALSSFGMGILTSYPHSEQTDCSKFCGSS